MSSYTLKNFHITLFAEYETQNLKKNCSHTLNYFFRVESCEDTKNVKWIIHQVKASLFEMKKYRE